MLRLSQPFSARLLLGGLLALSTPITGFAALPLPSSGLPALHIQGSNTIGAKLGPALVSGLLEKEGFSNVRVQESGINEQRVIGQDAQGRLVNIEVAAHGSGTGFTALGQNAAELAASSRPIKDSEAASLATLGDLKSPESEQVIAIDGLAVILHPSNPVQSLSVEQLARVFAGEVKTWEELGGRGGAIRLYARDDNSGTFDTFKELVLSSHGKTLATGAQRFESSNQLSDSVSQDPQGIGFIGLPYIRKAKPLAISAGDSQPMLPSTELVATEDYPLSRRLFFYMKPAESNPWAQALVRFVHSPSGQEIVARSGFISQTVKAMQVAANGDMPPAYHELASHAQRLAVNFRFAEGSAELDSKALRDVRRVVSYLKDNNKMMSQVVLVGFGDPRNNDRDRTELLSKLRAMAVQRELVKSGVLLRSITGLGDAMPVASNDSEAGRKKNRRVEVWVY
ncbi:substrate-binding domain-containing protein [Pseudomonas oryzae]|uniref:Phosphate ABC transporter substrate-binding protein, PhoT family n=1 Tax=Pseudomonas oryzae TaxID=1392877 RepID=A0A1H1R1P7_9PSED|nr:phosphate ABC transporter substrate-binding/OmpA family protein [Pseudomonas oryzae]SDS29445.1 phosphate ABC transporter substrate-binding protein, PhoT family [Pseudomonas oryzae]